MSRRTRIGGLFFVIAVLHVLGFGLLFGAGGGFLTLGIGITAYTLGMRHAFDVDHIGAIDNTTRKLMADGQRPVSVGFWFSLGHSTVVFVLAALVALGVKGWTSEGSEVQTVTGIIGPSVSGTFLIVIGLLNLAIFVGIARVFRRMRQGDFDEQELEDQLNSRGLMNRFLGRATAAVRQPWHMYPLGVLFGLGFDTATEVALLATAGTAATSGLPFYAILCLPFLFAAGMTLLDTLDGAFMTTAYDWAFAAPVRKVFYNLTITGLSVAVALGIGTIEIIQVLTGGLEGLDFTIIGFACAGLFALTWVVAVVVWRFGRIEERWTQALRTTE